jgi:hypothetical protein
MPINYIGRRNQLLYSIGLNICAHCGTGEKLTVHHCDGNGKSHSIGGRQQLTKLEKEYVAGIEMILLCSNCHELEHNALRAEEIGRGEQ